MIVVRRVLHNSRSVMPISSRMRGEKAARSASGGGSFGSTFWRAVLPDCHVILPPSALPPTWAQAGFLSRTQDASVDVATLQKSTKHNKNMAWWSSSMIPS